MSKTLVLPQRSFSKQLKSKRLSLKLSRPSLATALWKSIQMDQNGGGTSWLHLRSLDQVKKYIKKKSTKNPGLEMHYYLLNKKIEIVGSLHVHSINYIDHRLELGYWICKPFEGQGLASEALKVLEKEIKSLGFHRIEIRCHPRNQRSIQLAISNQYQYEGTLKQDTRVEGGFLDTVIYGKIIGSHEYYELA